jgi:hypothetical protein
MYMSCFACENSCFNNPEHFHLFCLLRDVPSIWHVLWRSHSCVHHIVCSVEATFNILGVSIAFLATGLVCV